MSEFIFWDPAEDLLQPKLTISMKQTGGGMLMAGTSIGGGGTIGGTNFIVRNNATGQYKHNSSMKPLTVNMANELTYKAVTISNTGEFYGQNPTKDDSYTGDDQQNCKWFLGDNFYVKEVDGHYTTYTNGQ